MSDFDTWWSTQRQIFFNRALVKKAWDHQQSRIDHLSQALEEAKSKLAWQDKQLQFVSGEHAN